MTDLATFLGGAAAPSAPAAAPAPTAGANPYAGNAAPQSSPYAPQDNDQRFYQAPNAADPRDMYARKDAGSWQDSRYANQQHVASKPEGEATQPGELLTLLDGSQVQYTAEQAELNTQLYNSVEQHYGSGSFDQMLSFAGTLSAGEQSSLERLVMSGDPAQMQRAVTYVAQKWQSSGQSARPAAQQQQYAPQYQQPQVPQYVAPTQYSAPAGLSQAEFYRELDNLKAQGLHEGHHAYQAAYQNLVAARSAGKRAGR